MNQTEEHFWMFYLSILAALLGGWIAKWSGNLALYVFSPLIFGAVLPPLLLWAFAIFSRSSLAPRAMRLPFVWPLRTWLLRPLLGYDRAQLVAYMVLAAVLAGHIAWIKGAFLDVPNVRTSTVERMLLDQTTRLALRDILVISRDRVRPDMFGKVDLPFPTILAEPGQGPRASLPRPKIWEFAGSQMLLLSCHSRRWTVEPQCMLKFRLPVIAYSGPARGQDPGFFAAAQTTAPPLDELSTFVYGLQIEISGTSDKIQIAARTSYRPRKTIGKTKAGSFVSLTGGRIDLSLAHGAQNVGSMSPRPLDLTSGDFGSLIENRAGWNLILTGQKHRFQTERAQYCAGLNMRLSECETSPLLAFEMVACAPGMGPDAVQCYRDFLTNLRLGINVSAYLDFVGESASVATKNPPSATYALGTLEQTAFVALLGASRGLDVTLTQDERRLLHNLKREIMRDYAIILAFDPSDPDAQDRKLIEQALVRQPQLFGFYWDRDFWGPKFKPVLEKQLAQLGFPQ